MVLTRPNERSRRRATLSMRRSSISSSSASKARTDSMTAAGELFFKTTNRSRWPLRSFSKISRASRETFVTDTASPALCINEFTVSIVAFLSENYQITSSRNYSSSVVSNPSKSRARVFDKHDVRQEEAIMFDPIISGNIARTRRPLAVALSFSGQVVLVTLAVVAPLLHTETIAPGYLRHV